MKIGSSPKRAGPMRSLPLQLHRSGAELHWSLMLGASRSARVPFSAALAFDQSNDWAEDGLVLRKLALANSRAVGSAVWRAGHAAWATRARSCLPRRHGRFLAGRRSPTRPSGPAVGRNAFTWSSVVAVRGGTLRFRIAHSPDGYLRPGGVVRTALLVPPISDPPFDLRRNAARDCACDGERPLSNFPKPTIVISKCIGFDPCRYNGGMVQDKFVACLKPYIEVISVCPEVEIELGVPRAPVRIICSGGELKLIQPSSGLDLSESMRGFTSGFSIVWEK